MSRLSGWLGVALVVALLAVLASQLDLNLFDQDDDDRGTASLAPGDCLGSRAVLLAEGNWGFDRVACTEAHCAEVILAVDYPGDEDAPFPGRDVIASWTSARCGATFRSYVGVPVEESMRVFRWFPPGSTAWAHGHRQVVCVVENRDGTALYASVKGTHE
jgi:Septum formation